MAKEVKTKKAKVSPWKVLGETLQFVGCPPVAIGKWISEAADKKAAQREAAGSMVAEKNEERDAKVEKAKELKSEGESINEVANDMKLEGVEVKKNESNET